MPPFWLAGARRSGSLRKTNAEPSNSIRSLTEQSPQRMHYWRDLRFERRPLGENVTYSGRGGAWVCTHFSQLREVLRLSNALPGGRPGERFQRIGRGILDSAPDSAQAAAALVARIPYGLDYTNVWFNDNRDSKQLIFAPQGDIKVTVEHDFFLAIPWAGRWIGKRYSFGGFGRNIWYVPIKESYTFRNEGEAIAPGW